MHLVFNREIETAKLFDEQGVEVGHWPMHNRAVAMGTGRWGQCPNGEYTLGLTRFEDSPPFGYYFVPVEGVPGRVGIGIHGGGSGLRDPFASFQGWVPTHGCFRMQNLHLAELLNLLPDIKTTRFSVS